MPLTSHHTRVWQIISDVGQSGEIPYILGSQQVPGRLLGSIIAGAKVLSINFNEQCWNHLSAGLKVMHDCATCSFVLYPPCGYFQGFPLPIGCWWHHYYVMLHPTEALPLWLSHPIRGLPTLTHPHACILPSGGILQGSFFIHLSERKHLLLKIHQAQLTHHLFVSYIQGKCMFTWHTAATLLVFQHNPHLFDVCAHDLSHDLSLTFILKMVDWTFEDALAAINSPPSIPTSVLESADGLCLGMFALRRFILLYGCMLCHLHFWRSW